MRVRIKCKLLYEMKTRNEVNRFSSTGSGLNIIIIKSFNSDWAYKKYSFFFSYFVLGFGFHSNLSKFCVTYFHD